MGPATCVLQKLSSLSQELLDLLLAGRIKRTPWDSDDNNTDVQKRLDVLTSCSLTLTFGVCIGQTQTRCRLRYFVILGLQLDEDSKELNGQPT